MKKITSKEPIEFRVDGNTVLEIGPEGCLADDNAAAVAVERLGENITVTDVDAKSAAKLATASGGGEGDTTTAPPAGPTHAQLKEEAKALGLTVGGSKADLEARIAEHKANPPAPEEGKAPEGEGDNSGGSE